MSGNIKGKKITVYQQIHINNVPNTNFISLGKAKHLDKLLEELIKLSSIIEGKPEEDLRAKWRYKLKVDFSNGEHYLKIPESSYEAVKRYLLSEIEIAQSKLREKIFNDLRNLCSEGLVQVYKTVHHLNNKNTLF